MTLPLSTVFSSNTTGRAHCSIRLMVKVFLPVALVCVFSAVMLAQNANEFPLYPKYQVLGVVYAPPGSASSVTYGSSTLVGSSHSKMMNSTYDSVTTSSQTTGFSLFGFGDSTTTSTSNSWGTSSSTSSSYSEQTTTGNSVTTLGPVSSALGVNHDNDIIYIWLNPVVIASLKGTGANGGAPFALNWGGLQFNSCDLTDASDKVNFLQLMNGCDPNQYPYADIVGIPVWCLKNPYFPAQSCAQWLPFTSRSWDLTPWGTDSNSVPLGPGLTLADYADILKSDPFISQTSILDQYTAGSYCHPTYGVNLDPNDTEVIPDSTKFPTTYLHSGASWPASFCGPASSVMSRFDPYGTVQYPVPGPNGEPQTYSGNFSYTTTSNTGVTATTTSSYSYNQNTTVSFAFSANFAALAPTSQTAQFFGSNLSAGFNFGFSNGNGYSDSSAQTYTTSKENATTNSASYSITGPQASDNYTGPVVFDVYKDNVYGTFAFYSNEQRQYPPIQLSVVSGQAPISVSATSNFGTVTVGSNSASQTLTLTNNSPYPMTIVGPAVTFSDPGFQIVPGLDFCSNVQLQPHGTLPFSCQITVEFSPVVSDAANAIQPNYPVNAYLVAAGTENISQWQNILVSNTGTVVSGTATPGSTTIGATLTPSTVQFASELSTNRTAQTQVFTFKNYYSVPVVISGSTATAGSGFTLSDATDYSITTDSCSGTTVASLSTCPVTLKYLPVGSAPTLNTKMTILGTPQGSAFAAPLAFAGASGPLTFAGISVSGNTSLTCYITQNATSGSCGSNSTLTLTNVGNYSVVLGTPTGTNGFTGSDGGTVAAQATTSAGFAASGTCNNGPFGNCTISGSVTYPGTAQTGGSGTPVSAFASGSLTMIFCPSPCIPPTASQIMINGEEKSATTTVPATPGKGSVTVGGAVAKTFSGTRQVTLTVGGFNANITYNATATKTTIAKKIAAALNVAQSPVTAAVNGDVVALKSIVAGAAGNLAYTAAGSADFSITPGSGSLTGGQDATTTTKYDGGTIAATVGSAAASSGWGKGSTSATIAKALATKLTAAANGAFTASASGALITIQPSGGGTTSSMSVNVSDTKGFTPASFLAGTGH